MNSINKNSLAIFILVVIACLLLGCVSNPQYKDPLLEISHKLSYSKPSRFKGVTLGVVFTENTIKAMNLLIDHRRELSSLGVFTNHSAVEDSDPAFPIKAVDLGLRQRFKDVVILGLQNRQPLSVQAIVFLDIQINLGSFSGSETKVSLQGVFVDSKNNSIEQMKGDGVGVIPFPATQCGF